MTVVDPDPSIHQGHPAVRQAHGPERSRREEVKGKLSRREKCQCRIEVNGLVDLDSEDKIKMCPVHEAAFQMLAALRRIRAEAGKAFDEVSDQTSAGRNARRIFTRIAKFSAPAIALAEKGRP